MRVSMPAPRAATHSQHGPRRWSRAAAIAVGLIAAPLAVGAPANADTVISGCTIVDNPTPTNHTNCPGVNLEKSELHGLNLSYANLSGARLYFTEFDSANLTSANLTGTNLTGASLRSTNLTGADLTGSDMHMSAAFGANLTDANLTNANLQYASLSRAKLNGANFTSADMTSARLDETVLVPSDQEAAADVATGTAVVTWPTPPNLTGTTFESCDRPSGSSFPVGESVVRCTVRTAVGGSAGGKFTVRVKPRTLPSVTGSPHEATMGELYVYQFAVAGEPVPDVTTTSALPRGLVLYTSGNLSGTPTQAGTFPLTLTARSVSGETTFETQIVVGGSTDGGAEGPSGNMFGS